MIKNLRSFYPVALTILVFAVIACKSPVQELTISVTHRVFSDYYEELQIRMGEKYQLSDTDYFIKAVDFVPDFAINSSTGEVASRSDSLKNPAVKLIIYKGKEKVEEVWAFQKVQAPHFSRQSMLGFKLLDFKIEDKFRKVEDKPDKTD
ncbi:MAG: hypothetical protein WBC88_03440 [Candidatus Zixiibacteriota bacterium]